MSVDIGKGLTEMSEKIGVSVDQLKSEMEQYKANLALAFSDQKEIDAAAFKQLRGAYRAQMKSTAKTWEGFFFAFQQVRNENRFMYTQAKEKYDKLTEEIAASKDYLNNIEIFVKRIEGKENADELIKEYKVELLNNMTTKAAVEKKITNTDGEFIFMEEDVSPTTKWKIGKVIEPESLVRDLYGFFKLADDDKAQPLFGVLQIRKNPEEFVPEMLKIYKFRAGGGKTIEEPLRLNGASVTKLQSVDANISFDEFIQFLATSKALSKNIKTFEEIFDDKNKVCKVPENPMFFISRVSIARYNETTKDDVAVDFVDLTDLVGDYSEPISMTIEKRLAMDIISENAVGVAIYRPYVKGKDSSFAGNLYGFISAAGAPPKPASIGPKNDEKENWE